MIEPIIQETASIDAATASLVSLPNFHSTLDASRIQRVPDMMLEFDVIKKKIDVASMIVSPDTD